MWLLFIALLWSGGIAWLIVRAVRQYKRHETLQPAPRYDEEMPELAVIVPARNEAGRVGRCLKGLLAQDYPAGRLRVVVVDDNSTDGTAAEVEATAAGDARVRLVRGAPLPPGWAGKPFACWQGAGAAGDGPEWLCFLDADTAPLPPLLRTAVRTARDRGIDMLTLMPFQELGTPSERLILPSGMMLMGFTQDLSRVNDPARREATANGQFLLFRREAYEAVGGFAAVRGEICEDRAMAVAVKRSGRRLALKGADELIRVRMYTGLWPLVEGLAKNVVPMCGGVAGTLGVVLLALALGWGTLAVPLAAAYAWAAGGAGVSAPVALAVSLAGSLSLLGMHVGAARHFRIPVWYGLLFPVGYTLAAALALYGVARQLRGAVVWKGRVYTPAGRPVSS